MLCSRFSSSHHGNGKVRLSSTKPALRTMENTASVHKKPPTKATSNPQLSCINCPHKLCPIPSCPSLKRARDLIRSIATNDQQQLLLDAIFCGETHSYIHSSNSSRCLSNVYEHTPFITCSLLTVSLCAPTSSQHDSTLKEKGHFLLFPMLQVSAQVLELVSASCLGTSQKHTEKAWDQALPMSSSTQL